MNSNCPSYLGWLSIFLTTLFVGLKLTNIIEWVWGWVLAPCWIYCLVILILTMISNVYSHILENKFYESNK